LFPLMALYTLFPGLPSEPVETCRGWTPDEVRATERGLLAAAHRLAPYPKLAQEYENARAYVSSALLKSGTRPAGNFWRRSTLCRTGRPGAYPGLCSAARPGSGACCTTNNWIKSLRRMRRTVSAASTWARPKRRSTAHRPSWRCTRPRRRYTRTKSRTSPQSDSSCVVRPRRRVNRVTECSEQRGCLTNGIGTGRPCGNPVVRLPPPLPVRISRYRPLGGSR
jgi:hypothetical protein